MQTHSQPNGPGEGIPDPVRIEVFRHLFTALAEEMGAALRSAAFSPNIKERRDYSCALFSPDGVTVAQGDHMPVHLGAMPMSVAAVLAALPELEAGDVAILNDPFEGGTHLPDITLTAPVYQDDGCLLGYVAARAHHSDVGGMSPGSMPLAREIFQEGLRIPPVLLHRRGDRVSEVWRMVLANVRTPEEREGDLEAQLGALHTGARRLRDMARRKGPDVVLGAMEELVAYGERLVREGLRRVPDGSWSAEDQMEDDGMGNGPLPIRVTLTVAGDRARLDFTGTAEQTEGGINAPAAVTASAARYVLRCVVEDVLGTTLPAGGGAFERLELILPDGSLVNARSPAAVAAGNVELSQRITDVLLRAFAQALPERIPALSQGTMNNTAVGGVDPRSGTTFTYYETVGGGMGAGPGGPGLAGVHTHMSNTLNTPVEALEHAYPFLVTRYEIRRGSGGPGLHRGGDGLRRDLEFSGPAQVTLLTERRLAGPSGAAGGGPGAVGENRLIRDGDERSLPAKASFRVQAGDILSIRSPGGGGWGEGG
jgi:N-methylhydantoinase B